MLVTREDIVNSESIANEDCNSIIRNHQILEDGYHSADTTGVHSYEGSSDNCPPGSLQSNEDILENNKYYNNDPKLRKHCAVVITPTKELIIFYKELLQKQRKALQKKNIEKQREKELKRRRLQAENEKKIRFLNNKGGDTTEAAADNVVKSSNRRTAGSCHEDSIDSEYEETDFQVRTRKRKQVCFNEMTEEAPTTTTITTTNMLCQTNAHLDTQQEPHNQFVLKEQHTQHNIGQTKNNNDDDNNQQTCDSTSDTGPTRIIREVNLLADTTTQQHLSPYQLDLPECNNPPASALVPAPAKDPPSSLSPAPEIMPQKDRKEEVPKENVTVTENLIIESTDNFIAQQQQQQEALISYAHESKPKDKPVTLKSSPCTHLLPINQKQYSMENNGDRSFPHKMSEKNETLEVKLDKVVKSATTTFNNPNPCSPTHSNSTIPLLISNVESLNHFEQNETVVAMPQLAADKVHLHLLDTKHTNNENVLLTASNQVSSIIYDTDLSNIPNESKIYNKNLPEVAETSPIVTDMSDNSNESEANKSFGFQPIISTNTAESISTSMTQCHNVATSHSLQDSLENSFNDLNYHLNRSTKSAAALLSRDVGATSNSTNDLNTPLKFLVQPEFQTAITSTPLRNTLEPETDHVNEFLDIILNKTVTDADSETHDKFVKELNALTAADTAATETAAAVSKTTEIMTSEERSNETRDGQTYVEENTTRIEEILEATDRHIVFKYSSNSHIENKSRAIENDESKTTPTTNEQNLLHIPIINNELNPPIETPKEDDRRTELFSDSDETTKHSDSITSNLASLCPTNKTETCEKMQNFNINCRVRIKRIYNDYHKATKKEAGVAIISPLTSSKEPLVYSNNDVSNCDTMEKAMQAFIIKKPDSKYNSKESVVLTDLEDIISKNVIHATMQMPIDVLPHKKPKLVQQMQTEPVTHSTTPTLPFSNLITTPSSTKPKHRPLKTVTYLPNLIEENTSANHHNKQQQKFKSSSKSHKKLSDNNLNPAENLQMYVNTINDSTCAPPSTEFNKERSPIKNKCIAEDETPRPLKDAKSKPSMSSTTCDNARIYTSSPLDQNLPEYDDNVDTVAAAESILKRHKKLPRKSVATDDITDDISNQPECNGEDDENELLPIPVANEDILEGIVTAPTSHIVATGTVLRDDFMNIDPTPTVPYKLFNDESRDLATPELQQSSDIMNGVDSSSYLNTPPCSATNNTVAVAADPTPITGNVENSIMSSQSAEHEVYSTQDKDNNTLHHETTSPHTKNKQQPTDIFGKKPSTTSKEEKLTKNNHSSEMCNLAITATTTTNSCTFGTAETTGNNSSSKTENELRDLKKVKRNGYLVKAEDKLKKFSTGVSVCNNSAGEARGGEDCTINSAQEKSSKSKRKKMKCSKYSKREPQSKRASPIVLKDSKLTSPPISQEPFKQESTIYHTMPPKPPTAIEQQHSAFLDIPNSVGKVKESLTLKDSQSPLNTVSEIVNTMPLEMIDSTTKKKKKLKINSDINSHSSSNTTTNYVNSNDNKNLLFAKDKYDIIKSKDKSHQTKQHSYHRNHHYDKHHDDVKEKLKDKNKSQTKDSTLSNTPLHKSSTKEKIKRDKLKEKHHKTKEKPCNQQQKTDILNFSSNKSSTPSTFSFSASNIKQNNSKSNKNCSLSSSLNPVPIVKSKRNLLATQQPTTVTAGAHGTAGPLQTAAAATNNVRKKLKIK